MKIELILATLAENDQDLIRLNSSIRPSTATVDLIVINQSQKKLSNIFKINNLSKIIIKNINLKGLSHARNIGLEFSSGDIVAFPDDDCYYDVNTLDQVNNFFERNSSVDVLIGRQVDPSNGLSPKMQTESQFNVGESDLSYVGNSICIFVRKNAITSAHRFEENLGAGRYFGSHEERDYLADLLNNGAKIFYDGKIVIFHKVYAFDEWSTSKAISYARGMGAYFSKHHGVSCLSAYWLILRPFIGALISAILFDRHSFKYRTVRIYGNIIGFFKFKKTDKK